MKIIKELEELRRFFIICPRRRMPIRPCCTVK